MSLKAGSSSGFSDKNTLATAIQTAFLQEWKNFMGDMPVPETNSQMQLFFVAIAKGIIQHLHDNPGAFAVHVNVNSGDGFVSAISIEPDPAVDLTI